MESENARSQYSEMSESRVLSTESENARSRYSELSESRVLSTENENARSRYSEISGSRVRSTESENARSRCSEMSGSRVRSIPIENAQSQWFSVRCGWIIRSRTLGWVGGTNRAAFVPVRCRLPRIDGRPSAAGVSVARFVG